MPPTRSVRGYRRISQACENCRRKKSRCLGERPSCSNCGRLQQQCQYSGHEDRGEHQVEPPNNELATRLAQIEERLGMRTRGVRASSNRRRTPETTVSPFSCSNLLPSKPLINEAIDVYFQCAHRQPLWLFDPGGSLHAESSEELLLTVLGLSSQYLPQRFVGLGLPSPKAYNDAARSLIMLKIANAGIDLPSLQALCLLGFSNLVVDDRHLASFHATMVKNLIQSSGLGSQLSQDRAPMFEEQRKLYWSVEFLDSMCGLEVKIPSIIEDLHRPRYLVVDGMLQHSLDQCPLLPQESYNNNEQPSLGIWAHMVRMSNIWSAVRAYMSRCYSGQEKAPWRPSSGYVLINSHLLDTETTFPTFYRYDAARFMDRTMEEINEKRQYWLPWVRMQITYHAYHCILNHPFLYTSRVQSPRPGHNAFWKSSLELALVHSTWIARLIRMATDKGLVLSDPFLGYAAGIAATLHFYWSRAADDKIKIPAERNLQTCRSLLSTMGSHWPICQSLSETLDEFLELSPVSDPIDPNRSSLKAANALLVRKLLDFPALPVPSASRTLFRNNFHEEIMLTTTRYEHQITLDRPALGTPSPDVHTGEGHYAPPPNWFSTTATTGPTKDHGHTEEEESAMHGDARNEIVGHANNILDLSTWGWDMTDANYMYGLSQSHWGFDGL